MAAELYLHFPKTIRYLLRGVGSSDLENWDLMSYLAFEKDYIQSLLKLGYQDALAKKESILRFFDDESDQRVSVKSSGADSLA